MERTAQLHGSVDPLDAIAKLKAAVAKIPNVVAEPAPEVNLLDINLMGTIYTSRAAFPHMKRQGAGDIVNISSSAGRRSGWQFASYATSKFGVTGFTEALRQEGGSQGIRVAIVEPGATATEIAESITDPKWREAIHHHTHNDNAMETQDIVDAIMLIVGLPRRANVTRILIQPTTDVAPMP